MPWPETIVEKYACENCSKLYDEKWYAEKCCPSQPNALLVCTLCNETFSTHFDDEKIRQHVTECFNADENGKPVIPQAELEAAGQKRLFQR